MSLTIINSVSDFGSHGSGSDIILVRDNDRTSGNHFYWDSTGTVNSGTVYAGSSGYWKMMYKGPVSVKWFGAVGDGSTDDKAAIQSTINYVKEVKGDIYLPEGTFAVENPVLIKNGVRSFTGPGKLKFTGTFPYTTGGFGVLDLDGSGWNDGEPVTNCRISISEIDANNVAVFCIYFSGGNSQINVHDIICVGIPQDKEAIRLSFGDMTNRGSCFSNTISNNKIYLPESESTNETKGISLVGLSIHSGAQVLDGNYFHDGGSSTLPEVPMYENFITGNYVTGGAHGIFIAGGLRNHVSGNILLSQAARSIHCSNASFNNVINSNICNYFESSGIIMAYNSNFNLVSDNYLYAPGVPEGGEAGIELGPGCIGNVIQNNYVNCAARYGVYMAISCSENIIEHNTILSYRLAGIVIESDWNDWASLPHSTGQGIYSRSTSIAPPITGFTGHQWPFSDCSNNIISGNIIKDGYNTGVAAIYLASVVGMNPTTPVTNFKITGTIIKDNTVTPTSISHNFYIYEQNADTTVETTIMNNNNFRSNDPTKLFFPNGRIRFSEIENNSVINNGLITIPPNTATPDVSIGKLFICTNSTSTTITNFINGKIGQEITVKLDIYVTLTSGTYIILNNTVTSPDANKLISFINVSGIWFETSRNF